MPWKESGVVNQRMKFVLRLEEGERMAELCREFGISRKTGYKIAERYERLGAIGLYDEPRKPQLVPHRTNAATVDLLLKARGRHPTWGPRKLRAWLLRQTPDVRLPAPSTIGSILKAHGLVEKRRPRRALPPSLTSLSLADRPNAVWCCDFKGQFRLGDGSMCYPLTISDLHTRYIVACEAMHRIRWEAVRTAFEAAFRELGVPAAIRTDNGSPFASRGLFGLTRLSVWWRKLGIQHQRIEPGHPEQNGAHERMHLTLKRETTRPAATNLLQQQERFDRFVEVYNTERPHEALGQQPPAAIYEKSSTSMAGLETEPRYPLHDFQRRVTASGHVRTGVDGRRVFFLSNALAGELVGLREIEAGRYLVSFGDLDLGTLEPARGVFVAYDREAA